MSATTARCIQYCTTWADNQNRGRKPPASPAWVWFGTVVPGRRICFISEKAILKLVPVIDTGHCYRNRLRGGRTMGGGGGGVCYGYDVLNALNDAFGSITNPVYIQAKTDLAQPAVPSFATVIKGTDLAAVYHRLAAFGLTEDPDSDTTNANRCGGWYDYLHGLSDRQAQKIAAARAAALTAGIPMTTAIHRRAGGPYANDTVDITTGGQTTIRSPYDYTFEQARVRRARAKRPRRVKRP